MIQSEACSDQRSAGTAFGCFHVAAKGWGTSGYEQKESLAG